MKKKLFLSLALLGAFTTASADYFTGWFTNYLNDEKAKLQKCIAGIKDNYKDLSAREAAAKLAFKECARTHEAPYKKGNIIKRLLTTHVEHMLADIEKCTRTKYEQYKSIPAEYLQAKLALHECANKFEW